MVQMEEFMKKFIALYLSYAILFCGCSSTHYFATCSQMKDEVEGKKVWIKLSNGEEVKGKVIKIGVDSTWKSIPISQDIVNIPASEVYEMRTKNHFLGCLEGVGFGSLIGGLIGFGAFAAVATSGDRLAGMWIPVGVVAGGLAGMPAGFIVGHKNEFLLSSSLPNEYVKIKLSDPPEKIPADTTQTKEIQPTKIQRKEFVRIEVNTILKETEEFITFLWKEKEIKIIKSEIRRIDKLADKTIIQIPKTLFLQNLK